ncbi:hypothetical protein C8R46DRAFT_68080 [Mycena filopes]|nr:hypothetical protein C8R46DRAFT_68080 [Mycena filopes]
MVFTAILMLFDVPACGRTKMHRWAFALDGGRRRERLGPLGKPCNQNIASRLLIFHHPRAPLVSQQAAAEAELKIFLPYDFKQSPRPEPAGLEAAPPIPHELLDRECLYGFTIEPEVIDTYRATHHRWIDDPCPKPLLRHTWNHAAITALADSMDLMVSIDDFGSYLVWFSYTKGGRIRETRVPTVARLEHFARELGLTTEKPQWHDAGLPVQDHW